MPSDTAPGGSGLRWWLVATLLAMVPFLGLGRGLWTPDEPREAEISREMYVHPTVIPTLNGDRFLEKPPLYYWTVAGVFAATGGPSVPAARAISGVAGLLTLLVVLVWGSRAHSREVGLAAAALLGTAGQFLVSTHWVLIDPLLMLLCTLAAWAGWELLHGGGGWRFTLLLCTSLGLALWTKGLIGPVLVVGGLVVYCVLERREGIWRRLRPVSVIGALALAFALLVLAIYLEGGKPALWEWGWVNHVQRFLDPKATGHRQPPWYYLTTLPVAVLPWLVAFLAVLRPAVWRRGGSDLPLMRYTASLAGASLVILSLAATKREIYLLPVLPPLFLLVAVVGRRALGTLETAPTRGWRVAAWVQGVLSIVVALAPAAAVIAYTRELWLSSALFLGASLACAGVIVSNLASGRFRRAFGAAVAAAAVASASAAVLIGPALDSEKDFAPFMRWLDTRLPRGEDVVVIGADETLRGIIPFVTGRKVDTLEPGDLAANTNVPGRLPRLVLLQEGDKHTLEPMLERRYSLVRARSFGPHRRLSLWHLRDG